MNNPVGMIAKLFAVAAIAVFASNVQAADNTVVWHGKTDPGKVVWRHVKNGGKRYKYALPVERYTHVGETDTIKIMYSPPGDGRYLEKSHNRCDGWFFVSPEQAGRWTVVAGYDDYIAIAFDGKWLVKNSQIDVARKSSWAATPGLHKFTLVFGDTGGTYGNTGRTRIPYSVSISVKGGPWQPFDDMVKAAARDKNAVARNGSKQKDPHRPAAGRAGGSTTPPSAAGKTGGRKPSSAAPAQGVAAAKTLPDPNVDLPPVRIRTDEEAGTAFKGTERKRRAKRSFPLVQPVADEGFLDNISPRGAIANVREMIRELVGPLEGEDEKLFEAKWNAVMDFPTKPIIEWLKKASPIVSEMVRIKSFIEEATSDFTDLIDEANRARMFGAFEDAERLMEDAEDLALSMQTAKKRMEELKAKLEELGEMPDPAEEKAAARKRRKEAEQAVRKAFGRKSVPETIANLCGIYMTGRYGAIGTPGVRVHVNDFAKKDSNFFGGAYAHHLWQADMITIELVSYDEETELALFKFGYKSCILRRDKNFRVEYAFGKCDDDGGLILYLPIQDNLVRTIEECEKDPKIKYSAVSIRPEDGGMCLRGHFLTKNKNDRVDSWFMTRRYKKTGKLGKGETVGFKKSERTDKENIAEWRKNWSKYAKAYEYMCDRYFEGAGRVKVEELPLADDMYMVLEKTEFCFRDPPYSKNDSRMRENQREGRAYMKSSNQYFKRARAEAEKSGTLKRGDEAAAFEDWTSAFEFGRNHLTYRYHGSINGWVKRGSKGEWRRLSHYDDNQSSFVGRWLPPKPVIRPWEPIQMAVHQTSDIDPAKDTYPPKSASLFVDFIHCVSSEIKKGDKYDKFVYSYGLGNSPTLRFNGKLSAGTGGAIVGEKAPPRWIYPETMAVVTIGLYNATGFHGTWGTDFVPEDPRSAPARGGVRLVYHFRVKFMSGEEADALSKELGKKYFAEAVRDWGENLALPDGFNVADYSAMGPRQAEKKASGEAGEEKKPRTKEEIAAENEAKKERIAFHNENIKFIDGTISRLRAEAAKEKDESRRKAIEWQIVCEESNRIHEQDLIRAEETGEFHASRTPFDNMCLMQTIESAMKEVNADRLMRKEQARLDAFIRPGSQFKLTPEQRQRVEHLMDEVDISDPTKAALAYRKISDNLLKSDVNATVGRASMLDDEILKYEDLLLRAQRVKLGCDITLALGGIAITGGAASGELAPIMATKFNVLKYTYAIGCGYAESGPKGIVKGAITTYSDIVDIVWSGVDGYYEGKKALRRGEKVNPWMEAAKAAGWSLFMNKGLPKIMEKVNWRKQITFGKSKTAAPKIDIDTPDVKAYKAEVAKAQADISAYVRAKNKINTMSEFDLASGKITDAQITKLRMEVVRTAAKINANPTAKAILKYEPGYGKIGKDFNLELGRVHAAVRGEFYKDMAAKGFKGVEINAIRNASSGKSVGMDSDWGIDETMKITRNGKPVSAYECMAEGQKSWNAKYKAVTGQDAEHFSWENITSHAHPEAYRNMDILKLDGTDAKMRNLLNRTSLADAQQIADVTRFKADSMLQGDKFPRLVYLREAARGSAKDMGGKFLPAIDAKMKPLVRLERMAGKHGKALTPGQQHELNRLRAAHDYYSKVYKVFDDIGKGKIPPGEWDARINEITGGRGISDTLGDLGDLFKSLVL